MRTTTDLWHYYGRVRAATDRAVPETFSWVWNQDGGPGPEVMGDLTGLHVAELGCGAARSAAHLAVHHRVARVDAVDASAAQHAMATGLYGHLAPRLHLVHSDAVSHMRASPAAYDVLYSVFGAVDFTDPHQLLPAAARALRPGGRLVFATLGHYRGGAPAEADAVPAEVPAKRPDGEPATMRRWVLQEQVWTKLLAAAGLTRITTDELPGSGEGGQAPVTLLVSARR